MICKWLKKKKTINSIPELGDKGDDVKVIQQSLKDKGFDVGSIDGVFGKKTLAALQAFQKSKGSAGTGVIGPKTLEWLGIEVKKSEKKNSPPWYIHALQFKGKRETDPAFNKMMSKKWSLFGMNLGTIATNWSAWCGLAMAVALAGVGIDYQRNGALARNWAKYGVAIDWKKDGIPQGAIVQLNSRSCSSGSGNHVSQANGDCTPEHLAKSGATIDLYGGNQGNTWKVSTYKVSTICAVRWPKDVKDYPLPGRVTKNEGCTSGPDSRESTR